MPTNFERIKQILDAICPPLDEPCGSGPKSIVPMIERLGGDYPKIWDGKNPPIDYSNPACHAAYIYTYMAANADLIYKALRDAGEPAADIFRRDDVKIACIGGGPGTELVGIFKYVERLKGATADLKCVVCDHEPHWQNAWPATLATKPAGTLAQMNFEPISLTDPSSVAASSSALSAADVITFSYSLSEAWRYDGDGAVSATVQAIIDNAKEGALIVYSDNAGDRFDPHMENALAARDDLELLDRSHYDHMLVGNDEEKSVLSEYAKWLSGKQSKLTGRATVATFLKK